MGPRHAARLGEWLDREAAGVAGPALHQVRRALARSAQRDDLIALAPHGTTVCHAADTDPPRRCLEFDRHGTLLAWLSWSGDGLDEAWLRLSDRSWVRIEPRAGAAGPGGASDHLWHADRLGGAATPLTSFEALDYARIERVPTLAEPARLPPGAGTTVLNLLAELALDQHSGALAYHGPFPTEQLFLSLLESFRAVDAEQSDPLAAFGAGHLRWSPAPHERLFAAAGVVVQLRGRVEKVVWRGRAYYRPDWPGVTRHAPRRVRDAEDGVRCSLWALGEAVEDHLVLTGEGDLVRTLAPPAPPAEVRPLPSAVADGVGAIVAATSAAALAPCLRAIGRDLALEWGPVDGDLVEPGGAAMRISSRLGARFGERARAASVAERAALGLAALTEIAFLLGDHLRALAQSRLAALGEAEQAARLAAPPAPDAGQARAIVEAVEALLAAVNSSRAGPSRR